MYNDSLSLGNSSGKFAKKFTQNKANFSKHIRVEGYNKDITETYYWFFNFAYYTGKGYVTLKLEDYHHFSENSQFGTGYRQVKGNSIQVFQQNINQLIQLIKVHLMPLLKEVRQADFYHKWISKITENDEKYWALKNKGVSNDNVELKKYKSERDEAISHLKDKWVTEIDGGKLWALNRSATEQGLDYALLPQLFFGTSLEDPLQRKKSLKEQLDEDIYSIDITRDAKEQAAKFMYRYYTWLPSAIKDTQVTFKLKIAALKNIYTQIQMTINFMRPLLMEIARKSEGFESSSFYRGFEMEHPDFVNLLDSSYSYVRTLGMRDYGLKERGQEWIIEDLEFNKYGLFIKPTKNPTILDGPMKGKSGFIIDEKDGKYFFVPASNKNISNDDYKKAKDKAIWIEKEHLKKFPIIELEFAQRRRTELKETPQGMQPTPFMKNKIDFKGYGWNIVEIASYRAKIKDTNLELLETFIDEIKVIREDLEYYVNYFENGSDEIERKEEKKESKNQDEKKADYTMLIGPFQGMYELIRPLIPGFEFSKKSNEIKNKKAGSKLDSIHTKVYISAIEDSWKLYSIYKKTHGLIQY